MEGAWEATRVAYPPLPLTENAATVPLAVQVADVAAQKRVPSASDAVADEDWVIEWFSPLSAIAEWQVKHSVGLTDEALKELLERLFGFGLSWAFLLGAWGRRPPNTDHATGVAALITCTFEKMAEVMTVEELATFISPNSGGGNTIPA
jgi:hypothetical protein